jgi:hypothetical protein
MARTKPTPPPLPHALIPLPAHTLPILRTGPQAVAYHIPTSPSSPSNPILKTTIALPLHSTWTSGLHFHTRHTEYLRLVQGAVHVHLDGEDKILSASTGGEIDLRTGALKAEGLVVKVPAYARHEWRRAEAWYAGRRSVGAKMTRPEDVGDEVVVEEYTDPSDLRKPLFFWNLNGIITATEDGELSVLQRVVRFVLGGWWIPFQLLVVFWELDNWPVFWDLRGIMRQFLGLKPWVYRHFGWRLEYAMTFVVLFAAKILGWWTGVRAVEQRRTPDKLWEAYKRHGI